MTPPDREADMHPAARASGPTISDAILALGETLDAAEMTFASLDHIAAKLSEWDSVGMEEIDEVRHLFEMH